YKFSFFSLVITPNKITIIPVIMKVKLKFIVTKEPITGYKIAINKLPNMLIVLNTVALFRVLICSFIPFINIILLEKPNPINKRINAILIGEKYIKAISI
ncbi:MAG: hypothetical protein P8Y97_08080, partial [Candidatus Lokiarchaeota archaeon]